MPHMSWSGNIHLFVPTVIIWSCVVLGVNPVTGF